ncbi:MAG: YhcH/YjgK/YiaL family protein [Actinobacteria bacterium]|nr:YhcH/YjgK/YiaL family protein [Actinomycetota bacterium]
MLIFDTLEELVAALGTTTWRRAAQAVQRADEVLPEVTLSIGDSLTYRVTGRPDCPTLTGRRRYLDVRAVLDGESVIEVAATTDLTAEGDYSDLTDREHFSGAGDSHTLTAGQIAVVEAHEAVRDVSVEGRVVVLRVTVEG